MARTVIIKDRCKGCLLCTTVCPKDILRQSQILNAQGYKVVEVTDMTECTGCASCAVMCPDMAIRVFTIPKKKGEKPHD